MPLACVKLVVTDLLACQEKLIRNRNERREELREGGREGGKEEEGEPQLGSALGHSFSAQPGHSQLCLSLHFLHA